MRRWNVFEEVALLRADRRVPIPLIAKRLGRSAPAVQRRMRMLRRNHPWSRR